MTKEEARQFKARWQLVNHAMTEEVRRTPASVKLQQLAVMYEAGQALGWTDALKEGEEGVRERWRRLKEKYHA
jgi:flagellar biosynthesis/type III secretory pathway protein FliH